MKPNPFSGLNHFTVPVATGVPSFRGRCGRIGEACPSAYPASAGEGTARTTVAQKPVLHEPSDWRVPDTADTCQRGTRRPRLVPVGATAPLMRRESRGAG